MRRRAAYHSHTSGHIETTRGSLQEYEDRLVVASKGENVVQMVAQQLLNRVHRAVAELERYHLGRRTDLQRALMKVRVFADDHQPVLGGIPPDHAVIGIPQSDGSDMERVGKEIREATNERGRQVLIEE
jgi:hypothetical protein